ARKQIRASLRHAYLPASKRSGQASLAGIEEKSLGALLIGDSRPIVGRQSRQHFRLQGGKSREVRGLRGRYNLLSRYFQTISLFHRAAFHNPITARLTVRRIPAICNPRPPILSARRIATKFASPSWCHCTAPSGSPLPKAIGAASGEATFAAKYALRHVSPFAVCEDATVRDDWICRTKQSVLLQESAQDDERSAPDVNGTRGWREHGIEVALPFWEEGEFEWPATSYGRSCRACRLCWHNAGVL